MKRIITLTLVLFCALSLFSQTVSLSVNAPGTISPNGLFRTITFTATVSGGTPEPRFQCGGSFIVTAYGVVNNICPFSPCVTLSATLSNSNRTATSQAFTIPAETIFISVYYIYTLGNGNSGGNEACANGSPTTAIITFNPATGALPIDLVDFKAKNADKSISLNWKTAEEKNVNFFALERSKNGRDFKEIAQIKTGLASKEYNFTDEKPFYGTSYYRLKMAENDGSAVNYSKTVSVSMSTKGVLKITPSLASDRITIDLPENLGEIKLNVLDISGRVIQSVITNSVQANMEISSLAQGMYLLRAESGKDVFTERFVKQ